ncbi:MAG: hypothetical protein ABIK22_04755 [candidate division WOR-3 bacterium]
MFTRILYIISEKQDEKNTVLELARQYNCVIYLTALSRTDQCPPPLTEGRTRRDTLQESHERRCWQDIYRLEEEFKRSGIKASVISQLGTINNIHSLASSTKADLILLPVSVLGDFDYELPEDTLINMPCPILLIPMQ